MHIGIDATCWHNPRGFGRFTRELVTHLVRTQATHRITLVVDRATGAAGGFPDGVDVIVVPTHRHPGASASASDWRSPLDLLRLGRAAGRCRADVFWFPAISHYYPVLGRTPLAVTVHDAMTETHPGLFFPTRRARLFWRTKVVVALRQASTLIVPSEAARQAVASAFDWPVDRIARVDEAAASQFTAQHDPARAAALFARHALPEHTPVVLYVGGIDPHKNLDALMRAMARLRDEGAAPCHLVLVGGERGTGAADGRAALERVRNALALHDRVTFTGFVSDDDLSILYNAAAMLVLPSLDEGFGLPVVEAMACGLPVAVSNRGALPALAADAGLTFDPDDVADMANAIGTLIGDPALRRTLGARALERAGAFSWSASARQLLAVLERTAAG